jgi:hypothetical protein
MSCGKECIYAACVDVCPDYKERPKRDRSKEYAKRQAWRNENRELVNAEARARRAANPEHYRKYWRERKRKERAAHV